MALSLLQVIEVPHRFVMGMSAVARDADWLEIDHDLASDLREKERLLAEHRDQVFVAQEGSEATQREALALLTDHVAKHHSAQYQRQGPRLRIVPAMRDIDVVALDDPPIVTAARLVQEDLVVMQRRSEGWCLTAAVVCFPTRWDLPSKLGLSMAAIHERVPAYAGALSRSADRFFDGVKPGLIFQRGNWSLVDDPALYLPSGKFRQERDASITPANAGERVWLRREHQTVRRLPETNTLLFAIRVLRDPLALAAGDPAVAEALLTSVRTMSSATKGYKSLPVLEEAVVTYLEQKVTQ